MKSKHITFILFFLVSTVTTIAQERFQFGVKTGFNATSFNTANYSFDHIKDDFNAGYKVGLFSRIRLIGNISLQPEFYYSRKNSSSSITINQATAEQEVTYFSWDVPLLVHARLIDLRIFNLYGIAGPVASFGVDENRSLIGQVQQEWEDDRFREHNWNFQFGAGIEISRFNFDFRFERGLNDMSLGRGFETRSSALLFSLAYTLF